MSRIGKEPIALSKEVKIKIENNSVFVEKGNNKLDLAIPEDIKIEITEGLVTVKRKNDLKHTRCLHGTIRVLIQNMIKGVTEGFKKELEIVGVGYKAQVKGKALVLNVGFSHTVDMAIPECKIAIEWDGEWHRKVVIENEREQFYKKAFIDFAKNKMTIIARTRTCLKKSASESAEFDSQIF